MRFAYYSTVVLLAASQNGAVLADTAAATATTSTAPEQKIAVADVSLSDACQHDDKQIVVTGAMFHFAPILADVAGQVASAGLGALATAISNASKAKAVGAEGVANFEFYSLTGGANIVAPKIGNGSENYCLTISLPAPAEKASAAAPEQRAALSPPRDAVEDSVEGHEIPGPPSDIIVVESHIETLRDGFYIQPVYISYRSALATLPSKKKLPAELQVTFSTPAKDPTTGTNAVFALARIQLPGIKPGDVLFAKDIHSRSPLLPFRPWDGAIAAVQPKLTATTMVSKAREDEMVAYAKMVQAIGLVPIAGRRDIVCRPESCPVWLKRDKDDKDNFFIAGQPYRDVNKVIEWAAGRSSTISANEKKELKAAIDERDKALRTIEQESARVYSQIGLAESPVHKKQGDDDDDDDDDDKEQRHEEMQRQAHAVGSASVDARIVLTKSENKLGMAIAAALTKQQPPAADAVKGLVYTATPAWSQAQSDYVIAKEKALQAQTAYDDATAAGDKSLIASTKLALITAQANANLKAAAASVAPPYPTLNN